MYSTVLNPVPAKVLKLLKGLTYLLQVMVREILPLDMLEHGP